MTTTNSPPTSLPASLHPLLTRGDDDALPFLRPTKPYDATLTSLINTLSHPPSLLAILHLLNDDLHSAHELAQNDDTNPSSNYVHSILHRREADYWNSKWWLDQFKHPFIPQLYECEEYGEASEKAKRFVDEVEALVGQKKGGRGGATTACGAQRKMNELKKWQWSEMKGLAEWVLEECGVEIDGQGAEEA